MNLSEEFLQRKFDDCYGNAITAKNDGDFAAAKRLLYEAAQCMDALAFESRATVRAERAEYAARLRAIADAIVVRVPARSTNGEAGDKAKSDADAFLNEFSQFYSADTLSGGFESVVGLDEAKDAVRRYVINPLLYPDAYSYNFVDNKAVLLEGPPGTGKTTFAKAVAKEVRQPFVLVNTAQLVNCYIGETAKNIDKLFDALRSYAVTHGCRVTVFFDEFDEIAKKRGGDDKTSQAAVPALLRNLDGLKTIGAFLIIANTNCASDLDAAIVDRFRRRFHIGLPDAVARKSLFASKLADVEREYIDRLDLDRAVELSDGLSGRDITFACDELKLMISEIKAKIAGHGNLNEQFLAIVADRKAAKPRSD